MKAHEVFKLAELIAANKPKEDRMKRPRTRAPRQFRQMNDYDIVAELHKALERADTLKKVLEDREKANKKEDKKKDGLSTQEWAMLLLLSYPIIGLLIYASYHK